MDARRNNAIVLISTVVMTAMLLIQLARTTLGWWLVLALVVALGVGIVVVGMKHLNPALLESLNRVSFLAPVIGLVLRVAGEQQVIAKGSDDEPKEPAIKGHADVVRAAAALRKDVLGQDALIAAFMSHLETALGVRARSPRTEGLTPLGVYLFVGGEGIGKCFLAEAVSRRLFHAGGFWRFDLSRSDAPGQALQALFGDGRQPGVLTEAVRNRPHGTIVVEHIEAVPAQALTPLVQVLEQGSIVDPTTSARVSFQNCVFVFTSTRRWQELGSARPQAVDHQDWLDRAKQVLSSAEPPLDLPLLEFMHDIFRFEPPDDDVKLAVIEALTERIFAEEGITLTWIEPDIAGDLLGRVTAEYGFSLLPRRLRKLLLRPIKYCKDQGLRELRLSRPMIDLTLTQPVMPSSGNGVIS